MAPVAVRSVPQKERVLSNIFPLRPSHLLVNGVNAEGFPAIVPTLLIMWGWGCRSAMHWAARSGSGGCVRALADCGADVCKPDKFGLTPLYLALHNGHEMNSGAPKVLMELGARWEGTSVKNLKGLTPEDMKAAGLDNSDEIFQSSTIKAGGSDDPANEPGLEEGIARVELKDDPAQNNNAGEISAPESS